MAFANTQDLRSELERDLPERPFSVSFWDGSGVPATTGDGPTFHFRSPQALAHVLRAPGELGLGRAYVSGLLDVDALAAAVEVIDEWRPPPIPLAAQARLARGLVRACGVAWPPRAPAV